MSEEFKNQLLTHARTVVDRAGRAQTEEATKQFLIIPFFRLLGYDPNDPDEIVPEADASFSDKFKNRVDYAIYKEGNPVIAIETKKVGSLSTANRGELKGYYNAVLTVKLGILTDGLTYQLYSDTEEENLMDNVDPENCYGVFYYGRRRHTNRPVAEQGEDGQKRYRRAQQIRYRPREEWIAIPVPDIGVPREHLEAARRAVANNRRPSGAGDRFWELSGGVLFCGGCGRRMSPDRQTNSSGSDRIYFYYRCPKRRIEGPGACPNEKTQRAEKVEAGVWEVISSLLADPDRLRLGLERMIERERSAVSRAPEREAALWTKRLEQLERKRSSFQDMAAEGLITFDELRTKLEILQRDHAQAKAELEAAFYRKEKIAALEADAESLLATYATVIPERIQSLDAEERHRVYELLDLRAVARCDGTVELTAPLGRIGLCVNQTQLHS